MGLFLCHEERLEDFPGQLKDTLVAVSVNFVVIMYELGDSGHRYHFHLKLATPLGKLYVLEIMPTILQVKTCFIHHEIRARQGDQNNLLVKED